MSGCILCQIHSEDVVLAIALNRESLSAGDRSPVQISAGEALNHEIGTISQLSTIDKDLDVLLTRRWIIDGQAETRRIDDVVIFHGARCIMCRQCGGDGVVKRVTDLQHFRIVGVDGLMRRRHDHLHIQLTQRNGAAGLLGDRRVLGHRRWHDGRRHFSVLSTASAGHKIPARLQTSNRGRCRSRCHRCLMGAVQSATCQLLRKHTELRRRKRGHEQGQIVVDHIRGSQIHIRRPTCRIGVIQGVNGLLQGRIRGCRGAHRQIVDYSICARGIRERRQLVGLERLAFQCLIDRDGFSRTCEWGCIGGCRANRQGAERRCRGGHPCEYSFEIHVHSFSVVSWAVTPRTHASSRTRRAMPDAMRGA